jgi:hypothetical protein
MSQPNGRCVGPRWVAFCWRVIEPGQSNEGQEEDGTVVIERMAEALNRHDLEAFAGRFDLNYRSDGTHLDRARLHLREVLGRADDAGRSAHLTRADGEAAQGSPV